MINLNDQIDRILSEQLKTVMPLLNDIPEGKQKDFLENSISNLVKNRTLDPTEFINQFAKIKGEEVDIEKLKELIKNHENGR